MFGQEIKALDNTLSSHRPRQSMEIRKTFSPRTLVSAKLVNCLPQSVLMISGLPNFSKAEIQRSTSIVCWIDAWLNTEFAHKKGKLVYVCDSRHLVQGIERDNVYN